LPPRASLNSRPRGACAKQCVYETRLNRGAVCSDNAALRPLRASVAPVHRPARNRATLSRRAPLARAAPIEQRTRKRAAMNTNSTNPAPATSSASTRKSMTLMQMLALIGASGLAVSLLARHFL
jgi:hypothetical protein